MKRIDPIDRATSAYAALTPDQQDVFRIWMRGYEAANGAGSKIPEPRRPGRPAGSRNKIKEPAVEPTTAASAAELFDKGRAVLAETERA